MFIDKDKQIGIYFSFDHISIIESRSKRILNKIKIPISIEQLNLSYLFTDELKVAAMLREQFIKAKIDSRLVSVGLPARELFIRYFELPIMPPKELDSAVIFEAKRYVPFKLEELFFDYQTKIIKNDKKMLALFVGVKKNLVNQYFSVFNQLNMKIVAIEPAHFSLIRLLQFPEDNQSCCAVIDVNSKEADITIVDNNFICFSRDLNMPPLNLMAQQNALQDANILIKFMNEIRISLDYYRRQPSSKSIDIVYYISDKQLAGWTDNLAKGLGIRVQNFSLIGNKDFPGIDDIELAKALSISLTGRLTSPIRINFSSRRSLDKKFEKTSFAPSFLPIQRIKQSIFWQDNVRYTSIICIVLLLFVKLYYFQKVWTIKNKNRLKGVEILMYKIREPYSSIENLREIKDRLDNDYSLLESKIQKRVFMTPFLDIIPRLVPEGIWLTGITFSKTKDSYSISLFAKVYVADETLISKTIDGFISNLRNDELLSKNFKLIEMGRVNREQTNNLAVARFEVTCR